VKKRTTSRPRHKREITRIGAYGIILRDGAILLCRLSAIVTGNVGKWTLPGGGIDFGEDPKDAVIREIAEETGLVARPGALADIHTSLVKRPEASYQRIRIIYHIDDVTGDLVFETEGSTDKCAWIPLSRVRTLPLVPLSRHALTLLPTADD